MLSQAKLLLWFQPAILQFATLGGLVFLSCMSGSIDASPTVFE